MDALSEALNSVRMTGAIFYHAVCTSPWGFAIPPLRDYAHLLAPKTERLVSYHLMTEGDAVARFGNGRDVPITAGDVLIVPHGDPHVVSNGRAPKIVDTDGTLDRFLAGDLSVLRIGGGGEATRFVCGFFGCERMPTAFFSPVSRWSSRSICATTWPASGLNIRSATWSRKRAVGGLVDPCFCRNGRSSLHRSAAPLHGATACGTDRLARCRSR